MISIERALEFTLAAAAEKAAPDRMPVETVSLETSLGRILREHIDADGDYPRFDKARPRMSSSLLEHVAKS